MPKAKVEENTGVGKSETLTPPVESKSENAEMFELLKGVSVALGAIDKRLTKIETGGRNEFKEAARAVDIASASDTRKGVDPRICDIVDEILGEDFGVDIKTNPDKPGYLFRLVVPERLSDKPREKRPVKDPLNLSIYLKDKDGNVVMEEYVAPDYRSRSLASTDNFDAIRQHCERVRGYIVAYYQKVSKPLPEFRVK